MLVVTQWLGVGSLLYAPASGASRRQYRWSISSITPVSLQGLESSHPAHHPSSDTQTSPILFLLQSGNLPQLEWWNKYKWVNGTRADFQSSSVSMEHVKESILTSYQGQICLFTKQDRSWFVFRVETESNSLTLNSFKAELFKESINRTRFTVIGDRLEQ